MDDATLTEYFYSGRPYKAILERIHRVYGVKKSMSWLKRRLRKLGLKRRIPDPPEDTIKGLLQVMLSTPDCLRGYRAVWKILQSRYKVLVRRDTVMKLLKEIDPEGVTSRKGRRLKRRSYHCKGPNFIWHLDGYDKLSPYGLCIHGCVDGYSRKLIWLKVSSTNHNPKVIARYYLESVENVGGCPRVLRGDFGTENCSVAKIHIAFRMNHNDNLAAGRSFIYGPSTANTRIESLWAMLRRFKVDWWMDLCRSLVAEGHFNKDDDIHRYTLGFVIEDLIRSDLDNFIEEWNGHSIRKNSQTTSPHGCPNDIYDMPSLNSTTDQLQSIDPMLWANCMINESITAPPLCPTKLKNVCEDVLCAVLDLRKTDITHTNCRNIYLQLVRRVTILYRIGMFSL